MRVHLESHGILGSINRVTRPEPLPAKVWALLKVAGKEFATDGAARLGAALSYYTIFSLVPLAFLVVAVTGFLLDDPERVGALLEQASNLMGDAVTEELERLVSVVVEQAGASLGVGLALAAFSASGIFLQVQAVLNRLFSVPEHHSSGVLAWFRRRVTALVSAVVISVAVMTPLLSVGALRFLTSRFIPEGWLRSWISLGVPLISLVMLIVVVGLVFQGLTAVVIPWKAAWRGGAFTAFAGLIASFLAGTYLSEFVGGSDTGTLGVVGGLAVLLFYFNLMWIVFLFGAELTKVYSDYLADGRILTPTEREHLQTRRQIEASLGGSPAEKRLEATGVLARTSLLAFLVGLVVGWRRSSR